MLWDIKQFNTGGITVLQGKKEKANEAEAVFKEITAENGQTSHMISNQQDLRHQESKHEKPHLRLMTLIQWKNKEEKKSLNI